jgi:nitrogen fixation/metabolism regulation signal transduction histidine kinase
LNETEVHIMSSSTKYAPSKRSRPQVLKRQKELFENNQLLDGFLTKIPAIFMVINEDRQIVYINNGALEFTGLKDIAPAIGKRPGELIGCIHSEEEAGGCGTSEACTYCGAVNAVLKCQKTGKKTVMDCRIMVGPEHTAYDLRVWASPLNIKNEKFIVITMQDIQNEKWRGFLERIFFHDLLNIMTPLLGNIELLKGKENNTTEPLILNIDKISNYIVEEIQTQQIIINAENDSLKIDPLKMNSKEFLVEMKTLFQDNNLFKEKNIEIALNSESIDLLTDKVILRRILGNMIKNALEASSNNGKVTIGCSKKDTEVEFWVHNPGYIPREIQLQIFTRSFSTKGSGRGLGTYSMKLLSRFLKGKISFYSSENHGTTFMIDIPIKL